MQMEKEKLLNKKPMVLVFAGPNGSGKSTITEYFDGIKNYTNADEVVKATGVSNIDAAKEVQKKRYESIEKKEDFSLLVSLNVFNEALMNDAVYKFKRYEDSSLSYSGIDRHAREQLVGGYSTVITQKEYLQQ